MSETPGRGISVSGWLHSVYTVQTSVGQPREDHVSHAISRVDEVGLAAAPAANTPHIPQDDDADADILSSFSAAPATS